MNSRILLLILGLVFSSMVKAQQPTTAELLKKIDVAIDKLDYYRSKKEAKIDSLKRILAASKTDLDEWNNCRAVAQTYGSHIIDSSLTYHERCIQIAERMHRNDLICISKSALAYQLSSGEKNIEALTLMESIDLKGVPMKEREEYYSAYTLIYGSLLASTTVTSLNSMFKEKYDCYSDTLLMLRPNSESRYQAGLEERAFKEGRYNEALKINDKRLAMTEPGSRNMAIVAYIRHEIYRELGNHEEEKRWLALSALCDITNGVMNQSALWELAQMLADEGDVDRAHAYINYSWDVASVYGQPTRSQQFFPILSSIDKVYVERLQNRTRLLYVFIAIEALMTLVLIVLLYKINRQRRKLSAAKVHLNQVNSEQEKLNQQLDAALKQVNETNEKLTENNQQLQKSNHQKESYIGTFLATCSVYIDKLDAYRLMVHRMVKNNQIDELYHITRSTESKEMELDELYANFDSVFLLLFPNFVEQFNSHLKPDCQQVPQKPGRLNTPLRIYALLRLGMTDPAKIASFLHCSTATIYNYRAKMRAATIGDRDSLEDFVHSIASA